MIRYSMKWVVATALAAALIGCAAPGPGPGSDADRSDPTVLAERGRHAEAAEAWLRVAEQRPDAAFDARAAAAKQWLEAGRTDRARAVIASLRGLDPDREQAFELDLLRAELALAERDFDTAKRLLAMPRTQVPLALRDRFDRLQIELEGEDPDSPAARLDALAEAVRQPSFRPATALSLLVDLPLAELERLRAAGADRPALVPWLDLAVTARSRLIDDPELERALESWRTRYGFEAELPDELAEWIRAWRETRPIPSSVAVLLPGEGPLAAAGGVLRDGLVSKWLDLPPDRRPRLDFHYLGAEPDASVSAYFEARAAGAEFVIGPLARDQVDLLVALPDTALPVLLLNRPMEPARPPRPAEPLAILALPPEEEAELAAVRALVGEHERAVVVAQDSDFGRRVADRFTETFELGGGRVLARTDYAPGEFDHTATLSLLLEIDRSERRIERLREVLSVEFEAVVQRRTDFDIVFLAVRGGDGLQIVPQLRFLDLPDTPLYSTSDIYPGSDVGTDLDGVQFPIAPWSLQEGPAAEQRRRAEALYPQLDTSPTLNVLYALGRDAMALVPWFSAMKRDPRLYVAGNVGRLRLADGVVLERDLPWARIVDGVPLRVEPDPAP